MCSGYRPPLPQYRFPRTAPTVLLLAMLEDMNGPQRRRIAETIKRGLERFPEDDQVRAAHELLYDLPSRLERK